MKWLNDYRMRIVLVVAAIALGGGNAKADFTFGEPVNLGPTVNSLSGDAIDFVSYDGLEMYFDSRRPGGYGNWDIWVSTRETTDDDWEEPVNLGSTINTSQGDTCAIISSNGLELYFSSNRPGGYGNYDLWMSSRTKTTDNWSDPVNLGLPVNSSNMDGGPFLTADGLELYFYSQRSGGYGSDDIWVSRRANKNDPWGEPTNLGPIVNSSASESFPFLSYDGLLLLFSEDYYGPIRPGGFGNLDMWVTRRASVLDPWGTPVNLGPIINTSSLDGGPRISTDGSTLYFCSERPGGYGGIWGDIYQAPIIPIIDLNGDGFIDTEDLLIMIDNWGTDKSLCDIGPTPLGDGVIDEVDLEVLMSYWGQEIFPLELIAYWKLDEIEGDIAHDSAVANDADVFSGALWQPEGGIIDGAIELDGFDDYISTPFIINPYEENFSVFAWIKGGAPGQVIISQQNGANWLIADASQGYLKTDLTGTMGRSAGQSLVSEVTITDGQWHRVGITWDGTNRVLYADDVAVASDTQTSLERSGIGLNIGCGPNEESGTFFSGLIDDVRIYNRAIAP
jgi:hypothetical protein